MTSRRPLAWAVIAMAVAAAIGGPGLAAGQLSAHRGLSTQRLPFVLTVAADGRTLSLDVMWRASCGDTVRTIRPAATTIAADGTFAWAGTHVNEQDDSDEDRQRMRISGRLERDGTLSGVWRGERDQYNGQGRSIDRTCDSRDVAFRVSRGGDTSQPAPQRDGAGHLVIALEDTPGDIATDGERVWLRSYGARIDGAGAPLSAVTAFDRLSGRPAAPVRLDDPGYSELAAGEGAAWLLHTFLPGRRLLRIDARTQQVVKGPQLRGHVAVGLAVGAGGVWVPTFNHILRVDPRSGRVLRSIRLRPDARVPALRRCKRGTNPEQIAIHDDRVWVITRTFLSCRSHAAARAFALGRKGPFYSLVRIDPRTNTIARAVTLSREYPVIAAGPSGVWGAGCAKVPRPRRFACPRLAVHRIDLRTGRPAVVVALPGAAAPRDVSLSPVAGLGVSRGAVWIVQEDPEPGSVSHDRDRPGALRRIDVATRRLTTARAIPRMPADLATDDAGAWIADSVNRTLIRIEP